MALGNLVFIGEDHHKGSGLAVHDTNPDTTPPAVEWMRPQAGSTGVSTLSPIGLSMSDNVDVESLTAETFTVRALGDSDAEAVKGHYSAQGGLVNFYPHAALQPSTTYEVVVTGVKDWTGNESELYTETFTTSAVARIRKVHPGSIIRSLGARVSTIGVLTTGMQIYTDRDGITMGEVPAFLNGQAAILTDNAHKDLPSHWWHAEFTVNNDADVYVLWDKSLRPTEWLTDDFVSTRYVLQVTGDDSDRIVYRRHVKKDTRVLLKGQGGRDKHSNYTIVVVPTEGRVAPLIEVVDGAGDNADHEYVFKKITEGGRVYTDRNYEWDGVQGELRDELAVVTSEDQRKQQTDEYVEFRINRASDVYVLSPLRNWNTVNRYEGKTFELLADKPYVEDNRGGWEEEGVRYTFKASFESGDIFSVGRTAGETSRSNYTLVVVPHRLISKSSTFDDGLNMRQLNSGAPVYINRNITFGTLPWYLEGQIAITAKDASETPDARTGYGTQTWPLTLRYTKKVDLFLLVDDTVPKTSASNYWFNNGTRFVRTGDVVEIEGRDGDTKWNVYAGIPGFYDEHSRARSRPISEHMALFVVPTGSHESGECRLMQSNFTPLRVGNPLGPTRAAAWQEPRPVGNFGLDSNEVWTLGDDSLTGPTGVAAGYAFSEPGRYTIERRINSRNRETDAICTELQVVYQTSTTPAATRSASIVSDESNVYNVNPDNDTVSAITQGADSAKAWEASVGSRPTTLALVNDKLWVVNQNSADIHVLNTSNGTTDRVVALGRGTRPFGVAASPDGQHVYVTTQAEGELYKFRANGTLAMSTRTERTQDSYGIGIPNLPDARGIAVSGDSATVYVTRFRSNGTTASVYKVDASTLKVTTISLAKNPGPDTDDAARGIPNYLNTVTISPDGAILKVPSVQANIDRGVFRDTQELTFETRVRAIVSHIDATTGTEILDKRIDFDDRDSATALAFSELGDFYAVALQGNNLVELRERRTGNLLGQANTGRAPRDLHIRESTLYVHNFLDRSIGIFDLSGLSDGSITDPSYIKTVDVVAAETLRSTVLKGKRIFYHADARMSADGYISCASCHLDGGHDGLVWDFTQAGEGLRNTITLEGRAGLGHGNVHWTANFDEIQDFENDIRNGFGGDGFLTDEQFETTKNPLGPAKATLSVPLDQLAAYVSSLKSIPDSPYRFSDEYDSARAVSGLSLFQARDCTRCHSGTNFTDGSRHDVGTIQASSGKGISVALAGVGFETPTLKGLWDTAPYFHNGQAASLAQTLNVVGHGKGENPAESLTEAEIGDLVHFLLTLDDRRPTVTVAGNETISEGDSVRFTFRMDRPMSVPVSVRVDVTETGDTLDEAVTVEQTVELAPFQTSTELVLQTIDDWVVENESTVTAALQDGDLYAVPSESGSSASVSVTSGDVAELALSVAEAQLREGESTYITLRITNGTTFESSQSFLLRFYEADDEIVYITALYEDYELSAIAGQPAGALALIRGGNGFRDRVTWWPQARMTFLPGESAVSVAVRAKPDATVEEVPETLSFAVDLRASVLPVEQSSAHVLTDSIVLRDAVDGELLTASFEGMPAYHDGQGRFSFELAFSDVIDLDTLNPLRRAFTIEGAEPADGFMRMKDGDARRWAITVAPDGDEPVQIAFVPNIERDCSHDNAVICTPDGRRWRNRVDATVMPRRTASVEAIESTVDEGSAVEFAVTLNRPAPAPLEVGLTMTATGSVLASQAPATVTFAQDADRATLSVATEDDSVVGPPGTVTVKLASGEGHTLGDASTAEVMVEDNDTAVFEVTATPAEIAEGESAAVQVALANGVTFAEDQTITLEVSGAVAETDYELSDTTLTLPAGAASAEASVAALADADPETSEAIVVTARHDGETIGEATTTVLGDDARLSALTLSAVDIGSFSPEMAEYAASVASDVDSVTVTADPSDPNASVEIALAPDASANATAHQVTLAEGENVITVTVTAQDTVTEQSYTVTVTRAAAVRDIALGDDNDLPVGLWGDGETLWVADLNEPVLFAYDLSSRTRNSARDIALGDGVGARTGLWGDGETLWVLDFSRKRLVAYNLSARARDAARDIVLDFRNGNFNPSGVWGNGETVWVSDRIARKLFAYRLSTGVRDEARDIVLGDGTLPTELWSNGETLWALLNTGTTPTKLHAFYLSTGARDEARDIVFRYVHNQTSGGGLWSDGETVWVGNATTGGLLYAYALPSPSSNASLTRLKLSGIDLGVFSPSQTSYTADVTDTVTGTTLKAFAAPGARFQISAPDVDTQVPGHQVSLEAGENVISVMVTAADGVTQRTYTVTVTSVVHSSDGALSALALSAIDFGTFSPDVTQYSASVAYDVDVTTVTAVASEARADVSITPEEDVDAHTPGHQVSLRTGTNTIGVAVTTGDGSTSQTYTVTVTRAPLLTAHVEGLPGSHDGSSEFQFHVVLSDDVAGLSHRTIRDQAVVATGGTVKRAKRRQRGRNREWTITIKPSGTASIQIRIIAVQGLLPLSEQLTLTVPGPQPAGSAGTRSALSTFSTNVAAPIALGGASPQPRLIALAQENTRPAGLWSDGAHLWVANADEDDRRLYAYGLTDGVHESTRDIVTEGVPRAVWSDEEIVWVSTRDGGGVLQAYRLSDGAREASRDVQLEGRRSSPAGMWSDRTTLWAVDWLGATVDAYGLADGTRDAGRDLRTLGLAGNWMASAVWSDGETMWVSDHDERVYAYHMADGTRETARELALGSEDWDPMGLWSDAEAIWMTGWEAPTMQVRDLPPPAPRLGALWTMLDSGEEDEPTGGLVRVPDAALRAGIETALGKGSGEAIRHSELSALEVLDVRGAGVVDLDGLGQAVGLRELDLSFNDLQDLAVLSRLPLLERLRLDGAVASAQQQSLSGLAELRELSVRSNGLESLDALRSLSRLQALDVGDNRLVDLQGLSGLTGLTQLNADRNRLRDLWGVASSTRLQALDVSGNTIGDLSPLANLSALRRLTVTDNVVVELDDVSRLTSLEELGLAGNAVEDLSALGSLNALRRLDLRGNPLEGVDRLASLPSLEWVHVGRCGITDFTALDGRSGLTVEGRSDQSGP